jgi:hypothetical protein
MLNTCTALLKLSTFPLNGVFTASLKYKIKNVKSMSIFTTAPSLKSDCLQQTSINASGGMIMNAELGSVWEEEEVAIYFKLTAQNLMRFPGSHGGECEDDCL